MPPLHRDRTNIILVISSVKAPELSCIYVVRLVQNGRKRAADPLKLSGGGTIELSMLMLGLNGLDVVGAAWTKTCGSKGFSSTLGVRIMNDNGSDLGDSRLPQAPAISACSSSSFS